MVDAANMRASLDWPSPGVLPPRANTEVILRGIMSAHGIFSLVIWPLRRNSMSKVSRYRPIAIASAAVALWAALIGSGSFTASTGRVLHCVREDFGILGGL